MKERREEKAEETSEEGLSLPVDGTRFIGTRTVP